MKPQRQTDQKIRVQAINYRDKRGETIVDFTYIKMIIREYDAQL